MGKKGVEKYLDMEIVLPFKTFYMEEYQVTLLPANHDRRKDCFIYVIQHEGKTLLYGHDSAMFGEETWQGLRQFSFDCVVLDRTMVEKAQIFEGYMGFPDNIKIRERITPIFKENGFVAAYDGLDIEF